jgi:hypothetical protein
MVGIAALDEVGLLVPTDDADETIEDTREETELNDDVAEAMTELSLSPILMVWVVVKVLLQEMLLGTAGAW